DHVEGALRERVPIYYGALDEREIATAIRSPAVLDRERVDVHSNHLGRSLRQDGRAKSLTACQVDHPLSCYELRREVIAMQMLVDDLNIVGPGNAALTCPLNKVGWRDALPAICAHRVRLRQVRVSASLLIRHCLPASGARLCVRRTRTGLDVGFNGPS